MAEPGAVEELTIDDARDFLYTSLKACERYAKSLQVLVDDLNTKTNHDPWLEAVTDECLKGATFHEQQLSRWTNFSERMNAYVDAVRKEADALAIDELSISNLDAEGNPKPKKESKFVHPELAKFKLEKQARILGKYGGAPAIGGGMVLPRAPRESILRATASPAAVEIHYSRTENKEASELARVMQFRTKKKDDDDKADWQKEVHEKRRSLAHDVEEEDVDPLSRNTAISTAAAASYATELTGRLRERQVQVAEAQAAAQAAEKAQPVDELAAATPELANKLKHRKSTLAEEEAAARAAMAEEEEPATPPPVAWSNPKAAFGGELAAALQKRNAAATPAPAAGASTSEVTTPARTPAPRPPLRTPGTPAAMPMSPELAAILQKRRTQQPDS